MTEAITRFRVLIRPADGSPGCTLICDCSGLYAGRPGDPVKLHEWYKTTVSSVTAWPGHGPVVLVACDWINARDAAAVAAIAAEICEASRWVVATGDDAEFARPAAG